MSGHADQARHGALSRWEKLGDEPFADTRVFQVRRKSLRHPKTGVVGDFFTLRCVDWANVVALTTTGELVMVHQYRFGMEDLSLEVPGGMIEPGEDPVEAGRRELLEETGFGGGQARLLATISPNPAILENRCHLIFIDGVSLQGGQAWDEHEELHVDVIPVDRVFEIARSGGIQHSLALNALFFFEPEWRRRQGRV